MIVKMNIRNSKKQTLNMHQKEIQSIHWLNDQLYDQLYGELYGELCGQNYMVKLYDNSVNSLLMIQDNSNRLRQSIIHQTNFKI